MNAAVAASPLPIAWGVSSRALDGKVSGDCHIVAPRTQTVLVAAIDGVGHGSEAAAAAHAAAAVLDQYADEPLVPLMRRCHEALRRTRGAVLSMASFDLRGNTMTWLGVGNVEGVLHRVGKFAGPPRDSLVLRGGVVGYQIPSLRTAERAVEAGDVLVLATDGIRAEFSTYSPIGRDIQEVADAILAHYAKHSDDALVLAVRYLGRPS